MTAPFPDDLRDAFRRLAQAQPVDAEVELETRHLTRQSLAARHFVAAVGDRVRFDHAQGAWYVWRGHRWHLDRNDGITRQWLDVLAVRFRDALAMPDGEARARTIAAIQAAGALDSAIAAGLRIAAASEPVALAGDEWDPDPWLLGCENGVVDLRTGQLRPGLPSDLVTRSTRHDFDPAAECPRWERFLLEVFAGDVELAAWFRRLIGASLVGTSKEILAIDYGSGNNGKSVCYGILGLVAGDYGVEIGIETLIGGRRDAGAPASDLMRLRGARLAFTSEPDQSARLKGATLKRLATIDKMTGRELHGRQQEWDPTHTLHVATNHLPEADDNSEGFWRRIALVPWSVHFRKSGEPGDGPLEDGQLKAELAGEVPGILAWVVRGAVEYAAAGGLHPFPTAVARETAIYRADEDVLAEFIEHHLEPADDNRVTASGELFAAYTKWADEAGVPKTQRLNTRRFGRLFAERYTLLGWPVERVVSGGRTAYRGLRTRAAATGDGAVAGGAGGFGGFAPSFAGSSYTGRESGETGESPFKATKPTNGPDRQTGTPWAEVLAERATDDAEVTA